MEEYLLKNLTGKPLPSFSKIMTDFDPEQVAGKMVLVCFWDMEQRPSRNCIMQLAEQAEQFQQKGVTVVIVQASEVDEKKLNEWVKKNNIPFPVGIVQGDEEKIHLAWGVKSLPWLILTNREHQVVAEGITLQVLEDKLKTD
jgi:peroxiredoxin